MGHPVETWQGRLHAFSGQMWTKGGVQNVLYGWPPEASAAIKVRNSRKSRWLFPSPTHKKVHRSYIESDGLPPGGRDLSPENTAVARRSGRIIGVIYRAMGGG